MGYADQQTSTGKGFGCAAMLAIVMIPLFPLLFGLFWGGAHSEPVPQCQRANELDFGLIFLALLAAGALVGVAVAKIVNRLAAEREDNGQSMAFLLLAVGLTVTAAALTLFVVFGMIA